MKLNFIQNLSDQVVRENHQLKAQLQLTRQQLKDYQQQMLEVIAATVPHKPLALTPQETLQEFVEMVRNEFTLLRQLKDHCSLLREKIEIQQEQIIANRNTINDLQIEVDKQLRLHEEAVKAAAEKQSKLKAQLEYQCSCNDKLTEEMSQLKIEKLKLQEAKRIAIQQIRITQKNKLIDFRVKNEEQHMLIENQLRKELEKRDNTIRDMSKSLAELTNSSTVSNSQQVLADIFRSLQNYQQLTSANLELKQENQHLREEVKDLFNRIIALEADLQEEKAIENNLRSQLERNMLEKQDVERQLVQRIAQIAHSEMDKQAMEEYYDSKWNSEYKKVKNKLQAAANAKIAQIQQKAEQKLEQYQFMVAKASRQKQEQLQIIEQLRYKFDKEQKEKSELENMITNLKKNLNELINIHRQNTMMTVEQIHVMKLMFSQTKAELLNIIMQRQKSITEQIKKIQTLRLLHNAQITEINRQHHQQVTQLHAQFSAKTSTLQITHAAHSADMQQQLRMQIQHNQYIKSIAQREFNVKLQEEVSLRLSAIAQKQQQMNDQDARWRDKFCEMEQLMVLSRRKLQQQMQAAKKEVAVVHDSQYLLHHERDSLNNHIRCLEAQSKAFQAELQQMKIILLQREASIAVLKRDLSSSRTETEVLLANRKLWKGELVDLQRQFTCELTSLKKAHSSQISFFKDRIRQLEELNKRKGLTRRQLEKLQSINTERESLRSQIHTKQAEKIVLQQTNDYYLARLRESEGQIGKNQFKNGHAILTRRPKKNRLCTNQVTSHRVMESKEPPFQRRRYAITSTQKHYHLSLSKGRLEERTHKAHLQTMPSLA